MSLSTDFYDRPVHGPDGRIALVRTLLGLKQIEFASELGVSRETVSHWENIGPDGLPRSRSRRRHSAAIADLARKHLGERLPEGAFFAPEETAMDAVLRELRGVKQELKK